jgi:hypothetical protein
LAKVVIDRTLLVNFSTKLCFLLGSSLLEGEDTDAELADLVCTGVFDVDWVLGAVVLPVALVEDVEEVEDPAVDVFEVLEVALEAAAGFAAGGDGFAFGLAEVAFAGPLAPLASAQKFLAFLSLCCSVDIPSRHSITCKRDWIRTD